MKRSGPPKRNLQQQQAWERRSRKRLPRQSARRKNERGERDACRAAVLGRDRSCRAAGLAPGRCASNDSNRPPLEVHELYPGSTRALTYTKPDLCIAVCQAHHDWITAHHDDAQRLGLVRPIPLDEHDIETKIVRRRPTQGETS